MANKLLQKKGDYCIDVLLKIKNKNLSQFIGTHSEIYPMCTDDLSYGKIATQSQTYTGINFDASCAVDGNTATCMRTNGIGPTSPYKTTWWKVDLSGVYSIYSVTILFKNYDGYGMFLAFSIRTCTCVYIDLGVGTKFCKVSFKKYGRLCDMYVF